MTIERLMLARVAGSADRRAADQRDDHSVSLVNCRRCALYPHLSVEKNISFLLRAVGMDKVEIRKKVEWAARMFGIERFLDRKPRQLSVSPQNETR